jgi:hypothetical protein
MYAILKDFAGPIATIIASVTAASITWYFASRQAQIAAQQAHTAKQQADTALDQLRYNLFEKRYAIYKDIQELIRLLINKSHSSDFNAFDVIPHYVVMSEARFFFPSKIYAWIEELEKDCQSFLASRPSRSTNPSAFAEKTQRLVNKMSDMPERFQEELGFRQLTHGSRL